MSTTVTLNIPAISCGHCVATIQRETKEVPGVLAVAGDPQAKTATFTLANEAVLTDVKATLVEIGYPRGELNDRKLEAGYWLLILSSFQFPASDAV